MKAVSQVAITEEDDLLLGYFKEKKPEKKDEKKGSAVTEGGLAPFRGVQKPAAAPTAAVAAVPPASPRHPGAAPTRNIGKLADFNVAEHAAKPVEVPEEVKGGFFCPSCGVKQTGQFCTACGTKFPDVSDTKPSQYVSVEDYVEELKTTAEMLERIQTTVSGEVSELYADDWSGLAGQLAGEKPALLNINDVVYCRPRRTIMGTLVMTPYQLFFEPVKITKFSKRVYGSNSSGVITVPLAAIERLDIPQVSSKSRREPNTILDAYCKDTRLLRFAFKDADQCRRASQVIAGYVFPGPENPKYLFCFAYQAALAKAFQTQNLWKEGILSGKTSPVDGWQLFNPIREYKRMGLPNADLVLSLVNENYGICHSYPSVLVLPVSLSEADIKQIAGFRSRGRIPVLSWKHPFGDQSIWRCSQPKTGVAGARCLPDEELLKKIKTINPGMKDKPLTIFDCRPRLNAWANKTAGKGFEDTINYTSCKMRFMNIENIHTMRIAYQKLSKACQKQIDDQEFPKGVMESGWLFHLSEVIKATVEMVVTVDRDGCSIMSHCSDGWDRTSQLVALSMLCLDPYYRTTIGFLRLIDKEWLSFGHKFGERTGHGDKNYNDEQRAPIFLQWLDCVYQFTCQFPRHFQFNSAFLVCLASHLYSCRFGTFLFDTESERDKFELKTKTASLWSYLLVSPAALDGHFTNPLYSFGGDGDLTLENCQKYRTTATPRERPTNVPSGVTETVEGEILGDIVGEMGDDELDDEQHAAPLTSKVLPCSPQNVRGSVLCPSWSLKRLTVWSDYYLRWNTEETQTIGHGAGLVPPYGSATTTLTSAESLYHQQIRNYQRELAEAREKIRQLELQAARNLSSEEKKEPLPEPSDAPATEPVAAPQPTDPQTGDVETEIDSFIAELEGRAAEVPAVSLSASLDPSATMDFDALVSPLSEDSLFASPEPTNEAPSEKSPNPFDPSSPGFELSLPVSSQPSSSNTSSANDSSPIEAEVRAEDSSSAVTSPIDGTSSITSEEAPQASGEQQTKQDVTPPPSLITPQPISSAAPTTSDPSPATPSELDTLPTSSVPPVSDAVGVEPPANDAPSISSPSSASASDAPTSDASISDASTSDAPTSDVPPTKHATPASDVPTSDVPPTSEPTSDVPSNVPPTSDAPTSDAPRSDAPTRDAPTSDAPPAGDAPPTRDATPTNDVPASVPTPPTSEPTNDVPSNVPTSNVSPVSDPPSGEPSNVPPSDVSSNTSSDAPLASAAVTPISAGDAVPASAEVSGDIPAQEAPPNAPAETPPSDSSPAEKVEAPTALLDENPVSYHTNAVTPAVGQELQPPLEGELVEEI